MATGTGKTLTSAAVIRLFLRSGNANRVLFLVDRIELENQAKKNFQNYLAPDYHTVIFKENVDDWRKAEVVVSTVQTLMFNNKYKRFFKPTDFSLIIADESHRSINGNSRAVFEYFLGYKLGLTATPKDYIKNIDVEKLKATDPRAWEKRQLLDSYKTFGCESGDPTYRYSLLDGVRDGYLINPTVVDARTDITTKLLADEGYAVISQGDEADEEQEETTEVETQETETKEKQEAKGWKSKLTLNSNLDSYGSLDAEIVDFAIVNDKGEISSSVDKNKQFRIKMKIQFKKDLNHPIFAYTIKDRKGTEITGTNTMLENYTPAHCKAGEIVIVNFDQIMTLQPGQYFLSFGCTGYNGDDLEIYHRLYNACHLEVFSKKEGTLGFFDLNSTVSYDGAIQTK